MHFLHLELTFTPHYIITDKGLLHVHYKYRPRALAVAKSHHNGIAIEHHDGTVVLTGVSAIMKEGMID